MNTARKGRPPKVVAWNQEDFGVRPLPNGWIFEAGAQNHCATVCPYGEGYLVAWYTGREGTSEQQVVLIWLDNKGTSRTIAVFDGGTGNPVLWAEPWGATLLFSRFEAGRGPVWARCSLWLSTITSEHGVSPPQPFPARVGLVGRCPPIVSPKNPETLLLPLYHEDPPYGAVYVRRKARPWVRLGLIGKGDDCLIQPTLWVIDGETLALCRNFTRRGKGKDRMALFSRSRGGKVWTDPVLSPVFQNVSNSIVVAPNGLDSYVVWNDGYGRKSLVIAPIKEPKRRVRLNTADQGSYPNVCWNGKDLAVVWTEGHRKSICLVVFPGVREKGARWPPTRRD